MRLRCVCGLIAAVYTMIGCGPHPLNDRAWVKDPRQLGERLRAYHPPPEPTHHEMGDASGLQDAKGELTLHQAMTLALVRNPELRAFSLDVRSAEAKALKAGLWPNPELEAEFENFGGSGVFEGNKSLETTISLAQALPLGGHIERRKELGRYEAQLAGWDYEAARLEVVTEVTRRYVAVLVAQRRVAIARDAYDLAKQVREMTRKRIEGGDAPQIELARAGVPVVIAGVDLRRSERALDAAKRRLAMTWGQSAVTFEAVTGHLDDLTKPPPSQSLVSLINQNPQIARWATQISARRVAARLAEAEAMPQVTGRIGYRHDRAEGADAIVAGLSLPLPIFDRRQGDVLAARLGAASAQQRRRAATLRLEGVLSQIYGRLVDSYEEAIALQTQALPHATEAFNATRDALEKGDIGFLDVIDVERTLVELRRQHLDALGEYHAAVAEIEGLIGRPLHDLNEPAAPSHQETQP